MSAIGFGDELVRDYLLFRGFLTALKAFDSEVKADKDRCFRPDRIVEHLSSCIINLDLNALRESWAHLDQRFFARLEHSFLGTARKLETALLRMYLVTCISSGRQDKLLEFFEKMTPDLQGQPEWKDWFALPFVKNADEHPTYSPFFNRQWQDTMLLSLHNFISVVFQSAAMPTILSYEEELLKLQQLTEENELLKKKLAALQAGETVDLPKTSRDLDSGGLRTPSELMDDFYVIAQEAPPENTGRSIKSLIRNISGGLPTSPVLSRRPTETRKTDENSSSSKLSKAKPRSPSVPPSQHTSTLHVFDSTRPKKDSPEATRSISHDEGQSTTTKVERKLLKPHSVPATSQSSIQTMKEEAMSGFIILSREKYSEHNSLITHCKFNCSGTAVASSDMDGVIKIWNAIPSVSTLSTIMSKTSVLSLDWDRKRERLLLYGGTTGIVRMYDTKERRVVKEICTENASNSNQRVLCICCSPLGTNFVTSTSTGEGGQLCLWDMKTLSMERQVLPKTDKSCVHCCSFNHNGQLLLIGFSDGTSSILDLRTFEIFASWPSHTGGVLSTEFSSDETSCYTMGSDKKFYSWSANRVGQKLSELEIHSDPFDSETISSYGKRFCFNSDGSHVLTCGPLGGVIYKLANSTTTPVLDIGGHNKSVNTVDWSAAMESSTCICGTVDGRVIVSTLLNQ
ncbi:WD repeat-containing protein 91 [Trichonephila inaurata madagascariensis]|uniref:WD repeat-containing protein 91 n=1 Tax=Trichonephila inaurata madagascariensis TaxID=2747483 RepID=A0A8X7CQS6_9ARAC|nr:WD repeat-containing protein 91 [Trichonephila inaurata madagascariensis]